MMENVCVLYDSNAVKICTAKSVSSEKRNNFIQYFINEKKEIKAWRDKGKEEKAWNTKMLRK
jgi:ABC-type proline/glycine betaine transport system ATPase subunit